MSKYETIGGYVTQGTTFAKLIHHLEEAQNQAETLSHLIRDQGSPKDLVLAKRWHQIGELFKGTQYSVTELAKGNLN